MELPEGYKLSESELLGPLVRDFLECMGKEEITDAELLALDFSLEWVSEFITGSIDSQMEKEYGVLYGSLPHIRTLIVGPLNEAKRIASVLNGTVTVRAKGKWTRYEE